MAKQNNHEQHLSNEYGSNTMNTNSVGSMSSNSISTTFPSNHHLLVRHTVDQLPPISHSQNQLSSGNSFELNGVTTSSLSEDSGLPLTTNSSISSGDSTRMGLCRFEFELAAESDAEVSQFDSLENCSDAGMSTENFNTLKKVPLAPIDPPPEFQDSPQTTLLRSKTLESSVLQSFSTKLAKNIVTTAITVMNTNTIYDEVPTITLKTKSLEILPTDSDVLYDRITRKRNEFDDDDESQLYQCEYHSYHRNDDYNHYHTYDIYASDSILNTHIDNIYDIPCDEYPTNASCDSLLAIESSDHFLIFNKTFSNKTDSLQSQMAKANEIQDYDLYYQNTSKVKNLEANKMDCSSIEPDSSATSTLASNTVNSNMSTNHSQATSLSVVTHNTDNIHSKSSTMSSLLKTKTSSSSTSTSITTFQHRKTPSILYSPLHYHANSNLSTGNRPNSRNSLNSRLSSSHNSLTISSSNKADDSTAFITQAMSHDALTSREISDFYNVPIDSDIYALPIDVIRPISSIKRSCLSRSTNTNLHKPTKLSSVEKFELKSTISMQSAVNDIKQIAVSNSSTSLLLKNKSKRFRSRLKYVRNNKKRKRYQQQLHGTDIGCSGNNIISSKSCRSNELSVVDKRNSVPENVIAEPIRMTLDEVKRFYTNLYSSSSESALELSAITRNMSRNNHNSYSNSNQTNNGSGSGRLNKLAISTASCVFGTFSSNKHSSNNNNTTTNNNNSNNFKNINNNSINIDNNDNNVSDSLTILKCDQRNCDLSHVNNNNNNNSNNLNDNIVNGSSSSYNVKTSIDANTPSSTQNRDTITNCAQLKLLNVRATVKNACGIKKISSSPSIAKENNADVLNTNTTQSTTTKKSQFSINLNLKQKFCSIFRFRKSFSTHHGSNSSNNQQIVTDYGTNDNDGNDDKKVKFSTRALPPLPLSLKGLNSTESSMNDSSNRPNETSNSERDSKRSDVQNTMDFAKNIEKVKEYGWYWGPISSEAAEKLLSNEPDGSFIVRDSSDDHYIFSLTFKLNNCVRHVRIEQDQGTFSFGSCAKFKSRTIMEFIENAVESSRSGRYLFFFHRRPEHGPMRVQLTNPVSRFKHIQSLQHMCRFVIRRAVVRKDLIQTLPLPRRLLDYLSYKNCYSEQIESDSSQSPQPSDTIDTRSDNNENVEHIILR